MLVVQQDRPEVEVYTFPGFRKISSRIPIGCRKAPRIMKSVVYGASTILIASRMTQPHSIQSFSSMDSKRRVLDIISRLLFVQYLVHLPAWLVGRPDHTTWVSRIVFRLPKLQDISTRQILQVIYFVDTAKLKMTRVRILLLLCLCPQMFCKILPFVLPG